MKLAIALCLLASPLAAQEFLTTETRLSDDDFYRLVACAAPVSGDCQKDIVRWSPADAQDVSIGIVQVAESYPPNLLQTIDNALDAAIAEVNAADANLRLTRSEISTIPDVGIHLLDIAEGDPIDGTGLDPLDGQIIEAAKAQLWWRGNLTLTEGAIVFGTDVDPGEVASIILEEVTQTMGLLTDIGGDYYQSRSIFSETSNQLTRLGRQDVMALRRHYP
jgi:hypothetical protein